MDSLQTCLHTLRSRRHGMKVVLHLLRMVHRWLEPRIHTLVHMRHALAIVDHLICTWAHFSRKMLLNLDVFLSRNAFTSLLVEERLTNLPRAG